MQVKCPKCRLKYNTTCTGGIKQLACVCPRCGTPFLYAINTQQDSHKHTDTKNNTNNNLHTTEGKQKNTLHTQNHTPDNQNNTAYLDWQRTTCTSNNNNTSQYLQPKPSNIHQRRIRHKPFYQSGIFVFFVLLIIVVYLIRSCWQKQQTTKINGADISQSTTTAFEKVNTTNHAHTQEVDPFTEIHPGKAPNWVQGTWTFVADYGTITIQISGDKITESIADKTATGTFYYENRRLICDFGDPDNITIYRLDTQRQQIDAGNGMLMQKE